MASITIDSVFQYNQTSTDSLKVVAIDSAGNPTTIPLNHILNRVDGSIIDKFEDQIEDYVDQVLETTTSINKEDVDTIFNS